LTFLNLSTFRQSRKWKCLQNQPKRAQNCSENSRHFHHFSSLLTTFTDLRLIPEQVTGPPKPLFSVKNCQESSLLAVSSLTVLSSTIWTRLGGSAWVSLICQKWRKVSKLTIILFLFTTFTDLRHVPNHGKPPLVHLPGHNSAQSSPLLTWVSESTLRRGLFS